LGLRFSMVTGRPIARALLSSVFGVASTLLIVGFGFLRRGGWCRRFLDVSRREHGRGGR